MEAHSGAMEVRLPLGHRGSSSHGGLPYRSLKAHPGAVMVHGCQEDVSPNNVSPNEKSRKFRPLDNASLGGCGPRILRPDPGLHQGTCQVKIIILEP
jgi:hypothetical protein